VTGASYLKVEVPVKKTRSVLVAFAIAAVLCGPVVSAGDKEEAAVKVAEAWLGLVDAGEYSKSWKQASVLLQGAVTEESWERAMGAVRTPLGKVIRRTVASAQYATELPGAPDGEYVVIQFETSFEHKRNAVETVTPMLGGGGTWEVSGYFIK
jgi:hypothetical protein